MPGLSLHSSGVARLSTGQAAGVANMGQSAAASSGQPVTVSTAAFGPSYSGSATGRYAGLKPNTPSGLAFWVGVGAVVALVVIRHSLPR